MTMDITKKIRMPHIRKICAEPNCPTQPSFNFEGETERLYCSKHQKPNMFSLKHKTCVEPNCPTRPYYGLPGNQAIYCVKHKTSGCMSYPKKICESEKCKEIALYNNNAKIPKRCELHKQDDDINLVERTCGNCELPEILNADNLCTYCDPKKFLGFRLGKQREVKAYLEVNNVKIDSYDRAIFQTDCNLKTRPDFTFDCHTHNIVLEVDENAHGNNNELCECTRMVNIAQAFMCPTIFIRYNPDHYYVNGKKMDPIKNVRLKLLLEWLRHLMALNHADLVKYGYCSMIQLYYNEFKPSCIEPVIITI